MWRHRCRHTFRTFLDRQALMPEPGRYRITLPSGKVSNPYLGAKIKAGFKEGRIPAGATVKVDGTDVGIEEFCNPPRVSTFVPVSDPVPKAEGSESVSSRRKMAAKIRKNMLGRYQVLYKCAKCKEGLHSPREDIGQSDTCPTCQTQFVVPGVKELQEFLERENAAAEQKAQAATEKAAIRAKRRVAKEEQRSARKKQLAAEEEEQLRMAESEEGRRMEQLEPRLSQKDGPTARQIEYARALGIPTPQNADKEKMSEMISKATRNKPNKPVKRQVDLAREYGVDTEGIESFEHMVSVIYRQIKARRWVFSVVRHVVKAKWRKHSESGLPDMYANQIALALQANTKLIEKIESKQGGEVSTGGDVWYRVTSKTPGTAEYKFVKDFDLPDHVVEQINVPQSGVGNGRRSQSESGCVLTLLLCFAAVVVAVYGASFVG